MPFAVQKLHVDRTLRTSNDKQLFSYFLILIIRKDMNAHIIFKSLWLFFSFHLIVGTLFDDKVLT